MELRQKRGIGSMIGKQKAFAKKFLREGVLFAGSPWVVIVL